MASIADSIMYELKCKTDNLMQGLSQAKGGLKSTSKEMEALGKKWGDVAKDLALRIAGPAAAFMTLKKIATSYFSDIEKVATETGAYSKETEELRKKQALLQRIHKEDIELYKKGREALTKFSISMSDLSASIMRQGMPVFTWLAEKMDVFATWISKNIPNITRFGKVAVITITAVGAALLILNKGLGGTASAIMRVTLAMLANPLTWIILGIGALILVIDDLITYLNGGESAFGEFWGASIKYAKEAWDAVVKYSKIAIEWIQQVWNNIRNTTAFKIVEQAAMDLWSHIQNIYNLIAGVVVFLWGLLKGAINWFIAGMERAYDSVGGWGAVFENVADVISGVFEVVGGVISAVIGTVTMLWGGLVALFTGDTQILKQGWQAFCDGFSAVWDGAVGVAKGVITSLTNAFRALLAFFDIGTNTVSRWGDRLREALNVGRLIDWIKEKLKNLLPDWVLKLVGSGSEVKTAEGTKAETTQRVASMDGWGYAPPSVRDIERAAQVQKNTNIQASADYKINQTFNVTTENPNFANALANQQAGSAVATLQGQDNARRANLAVQATSN